MSAPQNYHEFPEPSSKTSATIRSTPSAFNIRRIAELWRPDGNRLETLLATLARVSLRLVDRTTGIAYSADELQAKVLAAIADDVFGAALHLDSPPLSGSMVILGSLVIDGVAQTIPDLLPSGPDEWTSTGEPAADLTGGWVISYAVASSRWEFSKIVGGTTIAAWYGTDEGSPESVEVYHKIPFGPVPSSGDATIQSRGTEADHLLQMAIVDGGEELFICTQLTPVKWLQIGGETDELDTLATTFLTRNMSNMQVADRITAQTNLGLTGVFAKLSAYNTWDGMNIFSTPVVFNTLSSNLTPTNTNTSDLGSTSNRWKSGWFSGTVTANLYDGAGTNLTGTASSLTAGTATKLAAARTINGVSFDGSANVTVPAGSLTVSGQTGQLTFAGLASTNRVKTVRDAADTILELGGGYTPTGNWTNMKLVTPTIGDAAGTSLVLTADFTVGAGSVVGWNTQTKLRSPADGLFQISTNNGASGVTFDVSTNQVLQLGADHATTPANQTIKGMDVTTGTGGKLTIQGGTGSVAGGGLAFSTATTTSQVERMTISAAGDVGITSTITSPIYAMGAGGSIRPNGAGSATGQITVNTAGDTVITSTTAAASAASGALQVAGGGSFGGNLYVSNVYASASNAIGLTGRLALKAASDGNATMYASNQTTVANLTINNLAANGTATVAGQVELTGQAATNATSAMTRSLVMKEQMLQVGTYRPLHNGAGDLSNSGSGMTNVNDNLGVNLVGSTTASAWQRVCLTWVMTGNPGASGAAGNAAIPLAVAFNAFCYIEGAVNSEILCVVGEVGSGAPVALGSNPLAGRGFGFRIYWSTANSRREIEVFTHDGTSYTHSNTSTTVPFNCSSAVVDQLCSFVLASNANGTVKLFASVGASNGGGTRISETPLITWTGGPTSGGYGNKYISVFIRNGATPPTAVPQCKILNAAIHTGELY